MLYAGNRLKVYGSEFTGIALPGQMNGEYSDSKILPLQNMSGFVRQVLTVGVPGAPDNSSTYTLSVNGDAAVVSYTTDANATQAELQDGLFSAWRSNAIANSLGTISKVGTDLLVTANAFGISNQIVTNDEDLAVDETIAAGMGLWIPMGVIVVRATGEPPNTAKLPAAASNKVLGVTKLTRFEASESRGASREDGYPPQRVMDVVADVGVNKGIWVRTVEGSLTEDSTVYADVGGNPGFVTSAAGSNGGNIALAGIMKIAQAPVKTLDGNFVVCMNFHL
jgi:hypothetical protein